MYTKTAIGIIQLHCGTQYLKLKGLDFILFTMTTYNQFDKYEVIHLKQFLETPKTFLNIWSNISTSTVSYYDQLYL